jgi:hypothetical protein
MTSPFKITIGEQITEDDERAIHRCVSAFSDQHTPPRNWRPIRLVLRSDDGCVIGCRIDSGGVPIFVRSGGCQRIALAAVER